MNTKYDKILRELGVIHKIGKCGSLLKDGDGNFDILACISSETIALEYLLGGMDIPDYHMEYLRESLKQRKKIHKTLLNGKFRPHEDEMELLEDYKRALGMYLGHDTGWNKENSLLSFTNTEPLPSMAYMASPEEIDEYNKATEALMKLGIGCYTFGLSGSSNGEINKVDSATEKRFMEAENIAQDCILNKKEIPSDINKYLLDTLDVRKQWHEHKMQSQKKMTSDDVSQMLEELSRIPMR